MKKLILAFAWGVVGLALAQGDGEGQGLVVPDLNTLFSSPHALALFVVSLVSFLRKHLPVKLDGLVVPAVAFVLSLILAALGRALGYLGNDWLQFGITAGIEAPLIVSGVRTLIKGNESGESGGGGSAQASPDSALPDRTRLR
jgi:hypothetical protein